MTDAEQLEEIRRRVSTPGAGAGYPDRERLRYLLARLDAAEQALYDLRLESAAYARGLRDGAGQELARVKGVLEETARRYSRLAPQYDRPTREAFQASATAMHVVIPRLDPESGEGRP